MAIGQLSNVVDLVEYESDASLLLAELEFVVRG